MTLATAAGRVGATQFPPTDPSAATSLVSRAAGYMQRARETGDPSWYDRAAASLDDALRRAPDDYLAQRARAWVLLGQHRFREARVAAERARDRAPDDFWNWANLADACTELGDYACAEDAVERLTALRPGVVAYTRVAGLQALFGDRRAAIESLGLAARAAAADPAHPEVLAWVLVHLGDEHAALGDLPAATRAYDDALAAFPDYHLALAGLAHARAAAGRSAEAIVLYERVADRVPSITVYGALGDLCAAAGDAGAAERWYALALAMEHLAVAGGGTYGRELALFLADHGRDPATAVRLARDDASWRDDVHTADALAWALHADGRFREAKRAAHRALRLGTEQASFHHHAGMIALALGRPRVAARHLRRALALDPTFDLRQAAVARAALAALDGRRVARR